MFGIGHGPEIIILLVIVLLVFGPGKLPEIGSAVGRGIREFRDATNGRDDRPSPMITPPNQARSIQEPAQQWAPQAEVREPAGVEARASAPTDHASVGQ
jgi:TatA/E family protein of Tat protein translocase